MRDWNRRYIFVHGGINGTKFIMRNGADVETFKKSKTVKFEFFKSKIEMLKRAIRYGESG